MIKKQVNIKKTVLKVMSDKGLSTYDVVKLVAAAGLEDSPAERTIYRWLGEPGARISDKNASAIMTVLGITIK